MNPYYAVKTTNFVFTEIYIANSVCKQTISTRAVYRGISVTDPTILG